MQNSFRRFRRFALQHDDLPAFQAGFFVLTLLAAAMLTFGVFAVLIAAHATLDVVKYREVHRTGFRQTVLAVFRENLLDILLLTVGLTFAVYFHRTIILASVSGVLRAETTLIRAVGTLVPKYEILRRFLCLLGSLHDELLNASALTARWTDGEKLSLFLLVAVLFLLTFGSWFLGVPAQQYWGIFFSELLP